MSWSWNYDTAIEGGPAQESFGSQSDAESWIGESWRELLEAGVQSVTLLEDGRTVYSMSLEPAE